jgi:uncharacterized protein (TIGR00369 family)
VSETVRMQFELARVLGLRGLTIGDGRCVWATTVGDVHRNPYGAVHGGVLFTLVDYAMGGALTSALEGAQRCTTLEIKINYVAPATEGEVRAEAWVVSKGARVAVMEAKVTAGETLLAVATGTFYIQAAPVY